MEKLFDIRGYWHSGEGDSFDEKNMWEGQFLLKEDGIFEGIVTDPNSSYNEDRFIFGTFSPDEEIVINKITPINVSTPFIFSAKKDGGSYKGKFSCIDAFFGELAEFSMGITQIYVSDAEKLRDNIGKEIIVLKHLIERWKNNIMDDFDREIYEAFMQEHVPKVLQQPEKGGKQLILEPIDDEDDLPF